MAAGRAPHSPETRTANPHSSNTAAAQLRLTRRSEQLALRARHAQERIEAGARTSQLTAHAAALAKANVTGRFAARWALIGKDRDDPAFAEKVAALKAEEAAELARHTAELVGLVRAARRASGQLRTDRQRRERQALAERWRAYGRYLIPVGRFAVLESPQALASRARRVYFAAAASQVTRRRTDGRFSLGLPRLVLRRTGRPRR